jgi:hypothetical protein
MNDEMYGGPISPESSFGQGAQSAMEQLNQMMRLRQAQKAAAIAEQAAAYEADNSRNETPSWRQQREYDWPFFRLRNQPEKYRSNRPIINEAMIENAPIPEEYRTLLRNIWNSKKYSEREDIREYIVDAIMSNISPQRPDRDPALLPQPTRGNMYGRFPGRE